MAVPLVLGDFGGLLHVFISAWQSFDDHDGEDDDDDDNDDDDNDDDDE